MSEQVIEGFRLSPQQRRLWRQQMGGVTPTHRAVLAIEGPLVPERLRQALAEVVERYEIYRTSFRCLGGMEMPIQVIEENGSPTLHQGPSGATIFVAGEPSPVTLVLEAEGDDRHRLEISVSALCGDRRSLHLLVAEMVAGLTGDASDDEVLQYADFAEWQNELVESEESLEGHEYWRRQWSREMAEFALPFEREPAAGFVPGVVPVPLAAGLVDQIEATAVSLGTKLEAVLLASWLVLAKRYIERPDLVMGLHSTGRKYDELAFSHGPFEQTLPLRFELYPKESWSEVVTQVSRVLEEAAEWQEYCFWEALEEGEGEPNTPALSFEVQEAPGDLEAGTLRFSWLEEGSGAEAFKLHLRVRTNSPSAQVDLLYDSALYALEDIERLVQQLAASLAEAVAQPRRPLTDLWVLGAAERRQLLSEWSGGTADFPREANLLELFERRAHKVAERVAVLDGSGHLSYVELSRRAARLGDHLATLGAGPETPVALVLERSLDLLVGVFAALYSGGAFVALDPFQPEERLRRMLDSLAAPGGGHPVIVTETRWRSRWQGLDLPMVALDDPEVRRVFARNEVLRKRPATLPEHLAYLIFTSGSTGHPKGTMIQHRSVVHLWSALKGAGLAGGGEERVSLNAPLTFDASIKQLVRLLDGATLCLVPEDARPDGEALLDFLCEQRLEVLDSTPSQLGLLLSAGLLERPGRLLRRVLLGGEAVGAELWQRLAADADIEYYNVYGPTECTVDTTVERVTAGRTVPVIGRPLANVSIYVLDRDLRPVPVGMPGELLIGGAGLARGYRGAPKRTAQSFIPHPFGDTGERLYCSGDRVRYTADGALEFLSRVDFQLKVRGFRVELEEIESVLQEHAAVREAVVVPLKEGEADPGLTAYVVPRNRGALSGADGPLFELPNGLRVAYQNRNEVEYLYEEIFINRCYARHGVHLPEGACVFDVGANIGMFALFVNQYCKAPRVYSFEPLPPLLETLRTNCQRYAPETKIYPFGLTAEERVEKFTFYPHYTMMSGQSEYAAPEQEVQVVKRFLENQAEQEGGAENIALLEQAEELLAGRFAAEVVEAPLRRLSDVLREEGVEHIDLLKVDVQRAELEVLHGIDAEDWLRIDQVVMEFHQDPEETGSHPVVKLLESHGFDVVVEQDPLLVGTDRRNLFAMGPGVKERGLAAEVTALTPVVTDLAPELSLDDLRFFLEHRLPEYMRPRQFVALERLPLNRSGKVDRGALPVPDMTEFSNARVAPQNPFEEVLADLFAELLEADKIDVTVSFFDLGGHSLLATQLMTRVRETFRVQLPLRTLFEAPTVSELAVEVKVALGSDLGVDFPPLESLPQDVEGPLSFAQERLWFLHQLEPDSPMYNAPQILRVRGPLKVAALAETLRQIGLRHEVLRTRFGTVDGQPVLDVTPRPVELPLVDLSALDAARRLLEADLLVERLAWSPFDLNRDLPLRLALLEVGDEEHVMLFVMHHIAGDGWSMGVLEHEVQELYLALCAGQEPDLPELPVQYVDFAFWQRKVLAGDRFEALKSYWLGQLEGLPAVLALATDRPRLAHESYRGRGAATQLSSDLSARLLHLGRERRVTPFMIFLGIFQTLLYRYSHQRELAIGTAIAGRQELGVENLIGCFINLLVLKCDLQPPPTFGELLTRVRETTLEAYAHQDMPFERLVEELQPERSTSHAPLFQVMLIFQNAPERGLALPGLEVEGVEAESGVARGDLSLVMWEQDGRFHQNLQYNSDLFDHTTIERLLRHFHRLSTAFVANPEQAVLAPGLLSRGERHQVLQEWNDTVFETPAVELIQQLFERQVSEHSAAGAVLFIDEEGQVQGRLTYGELEARANRLAHHLHAEGAGPEILVALSLRRSTDLLVGLLGILKSGAAYVPLDPSFPRERLAYMLRDSGARLLVTEEVVLADLSPPPGLEVISLDRDGQAIAACPASPALPTGRGENLAYTIYTSGSTGQPKGVTLSHRPVVNFLTSMARRPGLRRGQTLLAVTTLSFDIAVLELFLPLSVGAQVALVSRETSADGQRLARAMKASGAHAMQATPATWQLLLEGGWQGTVGLDVLLCGGEALPRHLAERLLVRGREVWNLYGPTETTVWSAVELLRSCAGPVLLGRPIAKTHIVLLDPLQRPVPAGVAGEVYIGGAGLARGYHRRPALTASRFVPDPFARKAGVGARLYRVGDLARLRSDGRLEFLGRVDHQVKVRGFRIELGEIEAVLQTAVEEVVVVARPDASGHHALMAYVVPKGGGAQEVGPLLALLSRHLPAYMVPAVFVFLEVLPRTPNGKIDRAALPEPGATVEGRQSIFVAPRNPTEEILVAIWGEVLGVEAVGVFDDFFELGGHSLLAMRMFSRLRASFRLELPLRALFETPTIRGLAERLDQALRHGRQDVLPAIERVLREGELPLSFAQQRLWFFAQLEPGSAAYNMPTALRLRGVLNVSVLARSFGEVVRRHEVLRSTFEAPHGRAMQRIARCARLVLPVIDFSALPVVRREMVVAQWVRVEAGRPFDLERGPVFRQALFRLAEGEHILQITIHHIASDAWSMGLVARELTACYQAFMADRPAPLAPLPVQYADYAMWQRSWLRDELLEAETAFWRQRLDGVPATLDLPFDRPRPAFQTYRGATLPLHFAAADLKVLQAFAQKHQATLFMTALAAFMAVLARSSGQSSFTVGIPISGRNLVEVEDLIGFFVNTLVLRAAVGDDPRLVDLVARVREEMLEAHAHQHMPFEKLVEEMEPDRSLARAPLFQVLFVLNNNERESLEQVGEVELMPYDNPSASAQFDLTLLLSSQGDLLAGGLNYNTDLFDATTIQRLLAHFKTMLRTLVVEGERALSTVQMVSVAERHQLLQEWNLAPRGPSASGLLERFTAWAEKQPAMPAVVWSGGSLGYGELAARAFRLAHHLRALGAGPEVRVGIAMERSEEQLVSVLAVLAASAVYVPIDPTYPVNRLTFMIEDAHLAVLLTAEALLGGLPETTAEVVCPERDAHLLARYPAVPPRAGVDEQSLAYLLYTSGSTGRPKGVAMSHGPLANLISWQLERSAAGPGSRTLQFAFLSFDVSFQELFATWCAGGTLVLVDEDTRRDFRTLLPYLNELAVERLFLPFVALHHLAEVVAETGCRPHHLREIITAGEQLRVTPAIRALFVSLPQATLDNQYGPTETHVVTAWKLSPEDIECTVLPPIGRPVRQVTVRVLDGALKHAAIGVRGELHVGGRALARGYLGRPALTAERFVPDPFGELPGARLYRTGDVARSLADSTLEFLGRADHQVKVRGFRVELGEVEAALAEHPIVAQAVVEAMPGRTSVERRLVAFVVPRLKAALVDTASRDLLRDFLCDRLPEHMVPTTLVALESLPLTATGKIDRRALEVPEEMVSPAAGSPPRGLMEEMLASIWGEVLGREGIGSDDSFFALGGHSLLATQVMSRVRHVFGVELPLRVLFETPTITALARRLEGEVGDAAEMMVIEPLAVTGETLEYPLSFAQQRLWFLDQLYSGTAAYNIGLAFRLLGCLDVAALAHSQNEIVRRHHSLRTRFVSRGGQPFQVVVPAAEVALPLVDLGALPAVRAADELSRWSRVISMTPFELDQGPLLRTLLLRLAAEEHAVVLTQHHIVSDAWSLGILAHELAELYDASARRRPSTLAGLPIQYTDFAVWQRSWLRGERMANLMTWWRGQLSGAPTLLELPTDTPRLATQNIRGAGLRLPLGEALTVDLKDLSQRLGGTLFMVLLSVFKVLLSRHSGQEDLLVGTPVAGRNRLEIEPLIGFFVNTLVLRTDLSGAPDLAELVNRVRETALGAHTHQDLPFEKLVEELDPARNLSHKPLFQVMFVLQNTPERKIEHPSLVLVPLELTTEGAKFDLTLTMVDGSGGLRGRLSYNAELFDATTMQRMGGHFLRLLRAAVAESRAPVLDLPLLSVAEQAQLRLEWNDTATAEPPEPGLRKLFEEQVARFPQVVAVVGEGLWLSFAELDRRADRLAHHLAELGVGPESFVGLCCERDPLMLVGLLGILKAGGAYVPMVPTMPQERLAWLVQDSRMQVLLTFERHRPALPETGVRIFALDSKLGEGPALTADTAVGMPPAVAHRPEFAAYMIYTSGSTGLPKGVVVEHRQALGYLRGMALRVDFEPLSGFALVQPLAVDASFTALLPLFGVGAHPIHLISEDSALDPGAFRRYMKRHLVDVLKIAPSHLAALVAGGDAAEVMGRRLLVIGGEASDRSWLQGIARQASGLEIVNHYGPTETTVGMLTHVLRQGRNARSPTIPVGRPLAGTRVHVLDQGRRVPLGVPGELYVGGGFLARGYHGCPGRTAESFLPDPFSSSPGERLYKTGDRVRHLAGGEIEFLGRVDLQVKIRGFRVEPGEIEATLASHAAVEQAVVVVRETAQGPTLVAYTVASASVEAVELRHHLRQRLPEPMVPQVFVALTALPRTAHGKLNRSALPEPVFAPPSVSEGLADPLQEVLAAIWSEVLGVEGVGLGDDFFELGGHSLLVTRVISRVRRAFRVELPLRALFENPTLGRLAAAVAAARDGATSEGALGAPALERVAREQPLPLSFAQQRLWFFDQLEPGSSAYNQPRNLRFRGALEVPALLAGVAEVIRRHEVLRTTYANSEGRELVQIVHPPSTSIWPQVDLSGLGSTLVERELNRIARREARRPFDLERGPVFRGLLVCLAGEDHAVLSTLHHIAGDAGSGQILVRELATLYEAFATRRRSPLVELDVQYADFAHWQRRLLSGERLEVMSSYWRERLADHPELLDLPVDRPRPTVQGFRGANQPVVLAPTTVVALRILAQHGEASLFMVLLSAFQVLLARTSGQRDLVVGSPIEGRDREEIEGLIGFFINTLVLRARYRGEATFRDLLEEVRETTLDAYQHRDLPFDKLVELLEPERHLSHTPLFQVMFAFQGAAREEPAVAGLEVSSLGTKTGTATFDLTLSLVEGGRELGGFLNYKTDLFDRTTMTRFAGQLETLLAAVAEDAEIRLAQISLLHRAERQQLLLEWNDSRRHLELPTTLAAGIAAHAAAHPECIPLVSGVHHLSWVELAGRSNRLAHHLQNLGVGAESRVALGFERSPEMVVGLLGILAAGAAYVPMNPSYPQEQLDCLLSDSGARVLVTREGLTDRWADFDGTLVCLDRDGEQIAAHSPADPSTKTRPENLAYIIYTSGSSGRPKGVMVAHRSVLNHLTTRQQEVPFVATDTALQTLSMSFDAAVSELFIPLIFGGRLVLAEAGGEQDPTYLSAALAAHRVTVQQFPKSLFGALLETGNLSAGWALRRVFCGGEALPTSWVEKLARELSHCELVNLYGPTEGTVVATWWRSPGALEREMAPIGRPAGNTAALVLDLDLEPVPTGVGGELHLGGLGVARGYFERPGLTAERFVPHPWSRQGGERLYKTGDRVRHLRSGDLEFLGRFDHQVKVRGFRIELGEIEQALLHHSALREAVVLTRQEHGRPVGLVACAVAEGTPPGAEDLRRFLIERLPEFMVPGRFVIVEELPLTPSGKLDRRTLETLMEASANFEDRYTAPRSAVERTLAALWADVLRLDQVGVHDNFFQLGGDSILSIQIVARARQAGLQLTTQQVFRHQTVAELGQRVTVLDALGVTLPATGTMPLTPIQHWFFELEFENPHHFTQTFLLELDEPLHSGHLVRVVETLLDHHDALRMRYTHGPEGWWQECPEQETWRSFYDIDLTALPTDRGRTALEGAAAALQGSLDLARGPLLRLVQFELGGESGARLLLTAHHLVVDGISWRVLLADLAAGYQSLAAGEELVLPTKTTPFKAWAGRLEALAREGLSAAEHDLWLRQASVSVSALVKDFPEGKNSQGSATAYGVQLEPGETSALLERLPPVYRTRIDEVLLTALVRTFTPTGEQAAGPATLRVDLEGHGREELFEDLDISRTVGWFTAVYPVLLALPPVTAESFGDDLKRVKEQLRAVPRRGVGYGLLRYLSGDDEARGQLGAASAEVSFNYLGQLDLALPTNSPFRPAEESAGPILGSGEKRPYLLNVNARVIGGRLTVSWSYSANCFRETTVRAWAERFLAELHGLIEHCLTSGAGGFTPSDFPLTRLEAPALDRFYLLDPDLEEIYPLSPIQLGMLLYNLEGEGVRAYTEQMSCTIFGEVDLEALRQAWQEVMNRHPILRTSFHWQDLEEPVQVVHRVVELPFEFHRWEESEGWEERFANYLREDHARGFDPSEAPLIRLSLIELSPGVNKFVWTSHHLLADGWSTPVVVREVFAHYGARLRGGVAELEPCRAFRDYVAWLSVQDQDAAEAWWRRELVGFRTSTPVPAEGLERTGERGFGDLRSFLGVETTAALEGLARSSRVTLNTLFQAAWGLLLSRHGSCPDVVFGATVAGRPAALEGVETIVGPFLNTLPIRIRVAEESTVEEWLVALQGAQVERQRFEFSSFVQRWAEVPVGLPLFDTLLIFENYPTDYGDVGEAVEVGEEAFQLEVRDVRGAVRTRYPLNLVIKPGASMSLYFAFDRERLQAAAVEHLERQFRTLLEGLVVDPRRPVGAVSLLAPSEREQLVIEEAGPESKFLTRVRTFLAEWGVDGHRVDAAEALDLLDGVGRSVPVGATGELYLGLVEGEWVATGELARRAAVGSSEAPHLEHLGRMDQRVLILGRAVDPAVVERVLRRHPGVDQAFVSMLSGAAAKARLVAQVVAEGEQVDTAELRSFLAEHLPAHALPRHFDWLDRVPLRANGAVDRHALLALAERRGASAGRAPGSDLEQILLEIWREVLGLEDLDREADFLTLGGHSLLAIRLLSRLRAAFEVEISLEMLFEAPTAAALAPRIEALMSGGVECRMVALVPADRGAALPLSFAQERLWFLDQLMPGGTAYNMPMAFHLCGPLGVSSLARSFSEVLNRHEVLRTRYPAEAGKPRQHIVPTGAATVPVVDLSGLAVAEAVAQVLVGEEARRSFDLALDPVLRICLLRLGEEEHQLLLTLHHIAGDGWSMAILSGELMTLYSAFEEGVSPALPILPVQYADYAAWQRNWLRGEVLREEIMWWKHALGSAPPVLDLPTDRPRLARPSHRGGRCLFQLDADLCRDLTTLSQREGMTPYMVMLAAFALLLGRHARQEELVLGMPIAHRNRAETEGLIGFFVNVLPLRFDLARAGTSRDLLRQSRQAALGALAHQDLPLDKLVEELRPERLKDRSPFFDITFGMQNAPTGESVETPGLVVETAGRGEIVVRFDLTVWVQEFDGRFEVSWTFSTDLFDASTIETLERRYEALLSALVADPDQEIETLETVLPEAPKGRSGKGFKDLLRVQPKKITVDGA